MAQLNIEQAGIGYDTVGISNFLNKLNLDVIDDLIEINRGNRIIIVTTPDVVQAAIAKTLELKPNAQFKILIKTGSLTQISYFEGDWSSIIYSDLKPY